MCRMCFYIVLVGVGLFMYATTGDKFFQCRNSKNWEQVPCKITSSESSYSTSMKKGTTVYILNVSYSYEINDTLYSSDRVSFYGSSTSSLSEITKLEQNYPKDKETFCYVNPEKFEEAVLVRFPSDYRLSCYVFVVVFIVIIVILIELVLFFYSSSKAQKQFLQNMKVNSDEGYN